MADEPNGGSASVRNWEAKTLRVICVACLGIGCLAGYWLRGSASVPAQLPAVKAASTADSSVVTSFMRATDESGSKLQQAQPSPHKMPTLDDMKRMADTKAAPLLAKSKSDPKNAKLQNQIGLVYESAHQFREAAGYFEKSLQYDPSNIAVRADYASCLYYSGDVDGALAQLDKSLTYDPKHAGTLMNIGIIKWRGKNDVDGALAAWEKLLQYNPQFPQKDLVEHMITQAKQAKKTPATGGGQKG